MLWIEGKPGSGKSTLAKLISKQLKSRKGCIVADFYYSFRDGIKATAHNYMLQSITYQIWRQDERLFYHLHNRLKQLDKWIFKTEEEKSKFFMEMLESLHQTKLTLEIFIIVDGLDESDNQRRTEILRFLQRLTSPHPQSKCTLKVLLASRPDTDIVTAIHGSLVDGRRRLVLQRLNFNGIEQVVNKRFFALESRGDKRADALYSSHSANVFSSLKAYILNTAEGVFLWVDLVLKELEATVLGEKSYTLDEVSIKVRSLPVELRGPDGYYKMMVNNMAASANKKGEVALRRKLLAWITFPERSVSVAELEDVTGISDGSCHDLGQYDIRNFRAQDLAKDISARCGHFVEVSLAHATISIDSG